MKRMKQKLGIIGRGVVGRALIDQVEHQSSFEIAGVAVKSQKKHRDLPKKWRVEDPFELIDSDEIAVILEAINNTEDSLTYAVNALERGKTYITASKKMVAENLSTLQRAEEKGGGKLFYEAAVGGAIPIIRTLKEHFRGESVTEVRGILNGSCNYILSRMQEEELDFEIALKEAQQKGFAETDPTTDVEGHDTMHKAILIAFTLNGSKPDFNRIKVEGIRSVTLSDIREAKKQKQKVKLIASIKEESGKYSIDIRPTLVSEGDDLYSVDREMNAAVVNGMYSGSILLKGAGAGGNPTASAMLGDLLNAGNRNTELIQRLLKAI